MASAERLPPLPFPSLGTHLAAQVGGGISFLMKMPHPGASVWIAWAMAFVQLMDFVGNLKILLSLQAARSVHTKLSVLSCGTKVVGS